jgi:hypothetical protein
VPNLPVRPISRSLPNRAQMPSMELRMDRRTDFLSLLDRDTASSEEFGTHWGGLLEPGSGSHRSFVNPIDQRQHLVSASTGLWAGSSTFLSPGSFLGTHPPRIVEAYGHSTRNKAGELSERRWVSRLSSANESSPAEMQKMTRAVQTFCEQANPDCPEILRLYGVK